MICLSVPVSCRGDAEDGLRKAASLGADAVEFRMDYCRRVGEWFEEVVRGASLPVVAADRDPAEGGCSPRPPAERMEVLRRAARAGAAYVDCEYRFLSLLGEIPGGTRVIASVHDFTGMPDDPGKLMAEIARSRADVVKAAFTARCATDNFRLFAAMEKCPKPVIGICMGAAGEASRVAGRKWGNVLTYASDGEGEGTAPGQVSVRELREVYRYHAVGRNTVLYGVAGDPVAHSASPLVHNAAIAARGCDALYVKFLVEEDVGTFLAAAADMGVAGLSVTIPHKVAVMEHVEHVDDLCRRVGAANTLYREEGSWKAANTDVAAAVGSLRRAAGDLRGKKAAVLGAGGAARGVCIGLRDAGAEVLVVNRTVSKAERLARETGAEWCGYGDFTGAGCDILVNTTPVGMWPRTGEMPVDEGVLREGMVVFDLIYNPPRTRLLRAAEERGCTVVSGVDMFIAQAEEQFRIWFGEAPPPGLMRAAWERERGGSDT